MAMGITFVYLEILIRYVHDPFFVVVVVGAERVGLGLVGAGAARRAGHDDGRGYFGDVGFGL
jgi:hypothetical protein